MSTETPASLFVSDEWSGGRKPDGMVVGRFLIPPPPIISSITPSAESAEMPNPLGFASMLPERNPLLCK